MNDKDSQLIWESFENSISLPAEAQDEEVYDDLVAGDTPEQEEWESHYMGNDLDAIQELVDHLRNNYAEGRHYRLHVGRGDDLPNTIDIHKSIRVLIELLDAASGPPQGEGHFDGDEGDDWF